MPTTIRMSTFSAYLLAFVSVATVMLSACSQAEPEYVNEIKMDKGVLVALYKATGGANWENHTNWLTDKPLGEWYGVHTDFSGRVDTLQLSGNNLSGALPSALGGFSDLRWLLLQSNDLTGEIPPELSNVSTLEQLYLGYNALTGVIPQELGRLSNLTNLNLAANQLSGKMPITLGNLSNLEYLDLSDNQLTGPIPSTLGGLYRLENLYLSDNRLTGQIPPELGNLGSLQRLQLNRNQLSGQIPPDLLNLLDTLEQLWLNDNFFRGCTPTGLGIVLFNDLEYLRLPIC